jgi:hypothetical protein
MRFWCVSSLIFLWLMSFYSGVRRSGCICIYVYVYTYMYLYKYYIHIPMYIFMFSGLSSFQFIAQFHTNMFIKSVWSLIGEDKNEISILFSQFIYCYILINHHFASFSLIGEGGNNGKWSKFCSTWTARTWWRYISSFTIRDHTLLVNIFVSNWAINNCIFFLVKDYC